jgi:hypothetical protein
MPFIIVADHTPVVIERETRGALMAPREHQPDLFAAAGVLSGEF